MGSVHGDISARTARCRCRGEVAAHAPHLCARRSHRVVEVMATVLPTRSSGKTALNVTELGFGAAPFGNLYRPVSDSDARDTAIAAIDAGIAYFDTAPYYGFGLSERRVGDALRGHDGIVLSSKVGRLLKADATLRGSAERHGFCSPLPSDAQFDYSFQRAMASWEASKQRLGLARIDILYVPELSSFNHGVRHEATLVQRTSGGG